MSFVPEEPVIVLTATDVDLLWRNAGLSNLRLRHRSGDTTLYALLLKMHRVRLQRLTLADTGITERHESASEERIPWTVKQLAKATRRAERTIRKDIEDGQIKAQKTGRAWLIAHADAESYVASRRRVT